MSIYEQFIPGQWLDNIDVNDFVNLNKKPFFEEPLFLEKSSENIKNLFEKIKETIKHETNEITPVFSQLKGAKAEYIDQKIEKVFGVQSKRLEKKLSVSESVKEMARFYSFNMAPEREETRKTAYELFDDIAKSEIKKSLKMNLFSHAPTHYIPSFVHPDVRKVALYGTKRLIKDKKMYLKTLEQHLPTHEWMERRISIHQEIQALKELEKYAKLYKIAISEPAETAKEAMTYILLSITAAVIENPTIPFSLTQVIPFLDIYFEKEFLFQQITEVEAQELIDEFFLKLSLIRFTYSPNFLSQFEHAPYFFGETFGSNAVTKTTYRFLHSVRKFCVYPFSIRVIWEKNFPLPFRRFLEKMIKEGIPISFTNGQFLPGKSEMALFPYGMTGVIGEDILLDAGACNLEKVLYLALNGGKDVESNLNLTAVTQPTRQSSLEYDEAFSKLKDCLSYVVSLYVFMMNIVLYVNETRNHHPLRSSLMSNLPLYKVQFGFSHLEQVIRILHGISTNKYEIVRDQNGWIEKIITPNLVSFNQEVISAHLITFIEKELSRIPLYKMGKAKVRIYQRDRMELTDVNSLNDRMSLPADIIHVSFHHSVWAKEKTDIFSSIESFFSNEFTELHLSTHSDYICSNGILFKIAKGTN